MRVRSTLMEVAPTYWLDCECIWAEFAWPVLLEAAASCEVISTAAKMLHEINCCGFISPVGWASPLRQSTTQICRFALPGSGWRAMCKVVCDDFRISCHTCWQTTCTKYYKHVPVRPDRRAGSQRGRDSFSLTFSNPGNPVGISKSHSGKPGSSEAWPSPIADTARSHLDESSSICMMRLRQAAVRGSVSSKSVHAGRIFYRPAPYGMPAADSVSVLRVKSTDVPRTCHRARTSFTSPAVALALYDLICGRGRTCRAYCRRRQQAT